MIMIIIFGYYCNNGSDKGVLFIKIADKNVADL